MSPRGEIRAKTKMQNEKNNKTAAKAVTRITHIAGMSRPVGIPCKGVIYMPISFELSKKYKLLYLYHIYISRYV